MERCRDEGRDAEDESWFAADAEDLAAGNVVVGLAVHLNLTTYKIKCPNCGAPLDLVNIERAEAGEDDAPPLGGYNCTIIRPDTCPQCGRVVVFDGRW